MNVLDELAQALHVVRGEKHPWQIVNSIFLADQFGGRVTIAKWVVLERELQTPLPPLGFERGRYCLPAELQSKPIWSLIPYVLEYHPDWKWPEERTLAAWRDAQIFAGVREAVVEAAGVDADEVVRSATLAKDLGFE